MANRGRLSIRWQKGAVFAGNSAIVDANAVLF